MPKHSHFRVVLAALTPLLTLLLITASSSSAATAYSPHLRRYPYLTDVVSSFATINWGTDQYLSTGAVRYGAVGSESCTAHYVLATRNSIKVNRVPEYQWSAMLKLAPGAQYCYRVYQGSAPATEIDLLGSDASPSFWTQVPVGSSQPFSFAVFGDWGYVGSSGANPYQAHLMSLIANSGAHFAVTVGDNGYPAGNQTNYGDLVQTGTSISGVFGPQFWKVPGSFTPIFPATGNHGLASSDPVHPYLLNFPEAQAVALSGGRYARDTYCCLDGATSANYASAWYAFDAGLARFYVLDVAWQESNVGTASSPYQVDHDYHWTAASPEYQWLQADLAAHPGVLKFAFWHYPLYSDDPDNPSDTYLQGSSGLEGLLKQYGVNLAFAGHSHTYQRFYASPAGLPSWVNGGGGAPSTTLGTCTALDAYAIKFTTYGKACGSAPVPASADQYYHFNLVSVNGMHVTVSPTNSLGNTFDVQNYDFSSGSENIPPSTPSGLTAAAVSGTQINLAWSASADNTAVRGYDVYRNGTLLGTTDANTLVYSDTAPAPGTSYSYTVDAFDVYGNHSSISRSASATTPTAATYTFTPVADAYVRSDYPATNFGLDAALVADASPDYHSYLRFNVAEMSGTVTRATLRLYATTSSAVGCQVQSLADHTWDENLATYSKSPALGSPMSTSAPFSSGTWVDVDVTSLVSGSGLYDFAVTAPSAASMSFNSRDAGSNAPQLVIQTDSRPPTATPTATASATPTSTPTRTPTATPTLPPNPAISGNLGIAYGTVTYTDGVVKTVTADASGNYSLAVPYGWSGAITPSKPGYIFLPLHRSYTALVSKSTEQDYTPHAVLASAFHSIAAQDGWILESAENSKLGGTLNSTDTTIRLGDDAGRRQYLSVLSFPTGSLPDNAVVVGATLTLTRQSVIPTGARPLLIFQGLLFDVRRGYFGTASDLQASDFLAPGGGLGLSPSNLIIPWPAYQFFMPATAFRYINTSALKGGITQLRLRFKLPDNNDSVAQYISFFSGNYPITGYQPILTIKYYLR